MVVLSETDVFPLLAYEGHVDAVGGPKRLKKNCFSCGTFLFCLSCVVKWNGTNSASASVPSASLV